MAGSTVRLLGLLILSLILDMPVAVTRGCLVMCHHRAETAGDQSQAIAEYPKRRDVILRRLWQDRDIADRQAWLAQRPNRNYPLRPENIGHLVDVVSGQMH